MEKQHVILWRRIKKKIKNQERLKGGSQISTLHAIYESNSVVIFGKIPQSSIIFRPTIMFSNSYCWKNVCNCLEKIAPFLRNFFYHIFSFTITVLLQFYCLKMGFKNRIRSRYFDFTIREALTNLKDIHVFWWLRKQFRDR